MPNTDRCVSHLFSQNQSITSYDSVGNPTGLSFSDHTSESFAATYNEWDQVTAESVTLLQNSYDGDGQRLVRVAMQQGSTLSYLHHAHLGSLVPAAMRTAYHRTRGPVASRFLHPSQ